MTLTQTNVRRTLSLIKYTFPNDPSPRTLIGSYLSMLILIISSCTMTISSQVYLQKNETSDGLTNFATKAENGKVKCQYSLTSLREQPRHLFASDADDKHEAGSVFCEATKTQRSPTCETGVARQHNIASVRTEYL